MTCELQVSLRTSLFAHLYSSRISLYVDNVTNYDLLFHDRLIDAWVQSQLLCALHSFKTNNDMRDGLAVPAQRVLRFRWC